MTVSMLNPGREAAHAGTRPSYRHGQRNITSVLERLGTENEDKRSTEKNGLERRNVQGRS
jgi:hypothetical protein